MTSTNPNQHGNGLVRRRPLLSCAVVVAILAIGGGTVAALAARGSALPGQRSAASARDQQWRADISYLATRLPLVHVDGLTGTTWPAWRSAAARLASRVPQLTNGQVIAGMAHLVAMLRDDETQLVLPPSPAYPFDAWWVGSGLYLVSLPSADRQLLGSRLVAVDGLPIAAVLARLRAEIDYQDPGLAKNMEARYLTDARLLSWLSVTRSARSARLTVRTTGGKLMSLRLVPVDGRGPASVHIPLSPLYLQHQNEPYWLRVLAGQHAVYLKYNKCLAGDGFQRLAQRALRLLREHPGYRLIVDLRDNPGGDSAPFLALIAGIRADPALNRRGRIFGLVNGFTDSSASVDAYHLQSQTNALLVGQRVADPIDEYGNDNGRLALPHYGIVVQYTTKVVNGTGARYGIPDITVAPTVRDLLTGTDPVLAAALNYPGRSRS